MPRVIRPGAQQPQAPAPPRGRANDQHYEGITLRTKYDARPGMVDVQQARAGKGLIVGGIICAPVGVLLFLGFALSGGGESPLLALLLGLLMIGGPAAFMLGRFINWWNWG